MDPTTNWYPGHTTITDTAIRSMQFVAAKSEPTAAEEQSARFMMGSDTCFDQVKEFTLLGFNIKERFDSILDSSSFNKCSPYFMHRWNLFINIPFDIIKFEAIVRFNALRSENYNPFLKVFFKMVWLFSLLSRKYELVS